jgi:outer membrane protein assembly factor BamB
MFRVAAVLVVSSLLGATTACSPTASTPPECNPGRSTLSSIDRHSGRVSWVAALTQRSEQPLQVVDGTVVVTAPCGAGVVDLASGDVLYDDTTAGDLVGVAGHQLFTLDESENGSIPITGMALGSGPGSSYGTNTPFQAATVADGSLVTLYGDQLEAADQTGTGPSWWTQLPPTRHPRLLPSGHRLLVTADDGSTYAVDLADGTLDWRSIPPVPALFYFLRLTTVPGTVLTAAATEEEPSRHFVYASAASTGRLRWSRPALSVLGADRDLTVLRTVATVEAVDTTTGTLRWRHRVPEIDVHAEIPQAALTSGTVVVPQPGAPALALDRRTGRVRWRLPEASTASADGDVVVTSTLDRVTAVDAGTGALLWSRTAQRYLVEVAVAPTGEVLLLDSDIVPHLGA